MRAVLLGERAEWLAVHSILIHGLCIPSDVHHCTFANTGPACRQGSAREPPECDTLFWEQPVTPESSLAITVQRFPGSGKSGHAIEGGLRVLQIGLIDPSVRDGILRGETLLGE
jgi:hypothetical protein